jgi:hypothetical protein
VGAPVAISPTGKATFATANLSKEPTRSLRSSPVPASTSWGATARWPRCRPSSSGSRATFRTSSNGVAQTRSRRAARSRPRPRERVAARGQGDLHMVALSHPRRCVDGEEGTVFPGHS